MREDEANYIAWLVCVNGGNPEIMYSGYMTAFAYASAQLRAASPEDYRRVMSALSDGARVDFAANWEYWRQFEGRISEISNSVNDSYLRANRQADGVRSYGRMVDLLLAEYRLYTERQ
jgi:hypothetical protein